MEIIIFHGFVILVRDIAAEAGLNKSECKNPLYFDVLRKTKVITVTTVSLRTLSCTGIYVVCFRIFKKHEISIFQYLKTCLSSKPSSPCEIPANSAVRLDNSFRSHPSD
jgi:hypothetical protein